MPETRILQEKQYQYTLSIPSVLVRMLEWKKGDKIGIMLQDKQIVLTKEEG